VIVTSPAPLAEAESASMNRSKSVESIQAEQKEASGGAGGAYVSPNGASAPSK
jgi:hypothetical protein